MYICVWGGDLRLPTIITPQRQGYLSKMYSLASILLHTHHAVAQLWLHIAWNKGLLLLVTYGIKLQ